MSTTNKDDVFTVKPRYYYLKINKRDEKHVPLGTVMSVTHAIKGLDPKEWKRFRCEEVDKMIEFFTKLKQKHEKSDQPGLRKSALPKHK